MGPLRKELVSGLLTCPGAQDGRFLILRGTALTGHWIPCLLGVHILGKQQTTQPPRPEPPRKSEANAALENGSLAAPFSHFLQGKGLREQEVRPWEAQGCQGPGQEGTAVPGWGPAATVPGVPLSGLRSH